MKTILCYGDSNTYGYRPRDKKRHDHTVRWPMVMAAILNGLADRQDAKPLLHPEAGSAFAPASDPYWVVEEGLNGRTTCHEDPIEGDRNGLRQLIPILRSHRPLDLVIFMLGTNDLKHRFNPSLYEISRGAQLVAKAILNSETGPKDGPPKVLMVCPPPLVPSPAFARIFAANAVELSQELAAHYRVCAEECGAAFFDAGTVVNTSPVDGLHWEEEGHRAFAEALAKEARELLDGSLP
ncbi:MAG: SGNH/GDSL hydrolase family protein [Treponema sp.]|jgi:lysophospholipase L1-like esterase|nr:SGNH/GDSL hydrolase family protein [Treponema sp.]